MNNDMKNSLYMFSTDAVGFLVVLEIGTEDAVHVRQVLYH
jgi:hypothetical protein